MLATLLLLAAVSTPATATPVASPPPPAPRPSASAPAGPATDLGQGASVRLLAPDVWLYVSEREDGVASNSLVVSLPSGPLLVDPPWGDAQTEKVLDWVRRTMGRPVAGAVATHWHADRTGGVPALTRHGIRTGALALTVELAGAAGVVVPDSLFAAGAFADPRGFEVFFPGAGHARDNVVVWLPQARLLIGGCLVKAEEAQDLGFVGDADLAHWPLAIDAVRAQYPQAAIVIPGHGAPGTLRALDRTKELLSAQTKGTTH